MKRQRGVALLIALVILAIGASIMSAMLWNRGMDMYRTELVTTQEQALLYDLGAESWAEQILDRSWGKPDTLGSAWATHLPALPIQGGEIKGHIVDLQGRFNINNIVSEQGTLDGAQFAVLKRLLLELRIPQSLANAIADWLDRNDVPRSPGGAEIGYYASQKPPYAPTNGPITSITTLRLVRGMTPQYFDRLRLYLTALPIENTSVNINTATAPVLAALAPGLTLGEAKKLVRQRGDQGFASASQFEQSVNQRITVPIGIHSRFFELQARTILGSTHLTLYSLLYRYQHGTTISIGRSFSPY